MLKYVCGAWCMVTVFGYGEFGFGLDTVGMAAVNMALIEWRAFIETRCI